MQALDTNSEADKGQDGMHGGVWEAKDGCKANRGGDSHPNAGQACQGEVDPHLQPVQLAKHQDGVGEHDQVATDHQERVKEDCLCADVREALAGVGDDAGSLGGAVQGHLHKLVLPVYADPGYCCTNNTYTKRLIKSHLSACWTSIPVDWMVTSSAASGTLGSSISTLSSST